MITNIGLGIHTDKELPTRREHDFYPTDTDTVWSVLTELEIHLGVTHYPAWTKPTEALDPGAGTGIWGTVAKEFWPKLYVCGVEIREEPKPPGYGEWVTADFLDWAPNASDQYDLVIGNPPYKRLEEKFIRAGMRLLKPGGHLVFLLRLAYLASVGRRDGLFKEFPPEEVWVCSKRPSFTPDGKTNATDFCAILWQQGHRGETKLRLLG